MTKHGNPELDADAAKLEAMGADAGLGFDDLCDQQGDDRGMSNLPNYDAWKLASPYEMSAAEEAALEAKSAEQQSDFREAIAAVLSDNRQDIYLATIRKIVIEELNKLQPQPSEPEWQTKTPIPLPTMG